MPSGPLKIKEKIYSNNGLPPGMPSNTVKLYQERLLHCQRNIQACWSSAIPCRELLCCCRSSCWSGVTETKNAAVQTCLLVVCCCKMNACWTVATQSACLLIFCHPILHVCCYCASLSALPAGVVSHYQPCKLVWCLTISIAC